MHNAIQEMALAVVSFFIMQFGICQEKPVHHPLAVFLNHSRMIPQGFLHVGECAFDHIVCVGHTSDFLVCKQKRKVGRYADHGRSEPLMGIYRASGNLVDRLFFQEVMRFALPFLICTDECTFINIL